MKIATWNVNSIIARLPLVIRWLEKEKPDVLCMQETKCSDDKFPSLDFKSAG
jgi:exodeoxyribonuclease-3